MNTSLWRTAGAVALLSTVLVQLALGADVLVLLFSIASLLIGLYPLVAVGRDLYTCFAALFCLRYTGGVLFAKTAYGQPLDSLLRAPLESYALAALLTAVVVGLTMLARRWDRGTTIFAATTSAEQGRQIGGLAYLIGAAAGLVAGLITDRTGEAGSGGAVYVAANALMNMLYLGYAAEIIYTLQRSDRRKLVSSRLVAMLAYAIALALFLNVRSIAVNSVICVFFCAFLFGAIKVRHLVTGVMLAVVFSTYVTPVVLELRTIKEGRTASQFASDIVEVVARTASEPGYIQELQRKEAFRARFDSGTMQYDYFGDASNVLNRLAFVALLDAVYHQTRVLNPIGDKALTQQVLPRTAPSFLVEKEARAYGYGDWLSWEIGLIEYGRVAYLSFPLPVEGVAVFGALLGVTVWPILFMLPMMLLLGRVSSFRIPTATSIFLLSAFHWELIEGASDTYIGTMTRSLPIMIVPVWCLIWAWAHQTRKASGPALPQARTAAQRSAASRAPLGREVDARYAASAAGQVP